MKKLFLCVLLSVGLLVAENNANSANGENGYPKEYTAEDIEFYEAGGESLEQAIFFCNQSGGVAHYGLHICQALKAFKESILYAEANNKAKFKLAMKELCFWAMKMSEYEFKWLGSFRDNTDSPLFVPSEGKAFLKKCAKAK